MGQICPLYPTRAGVHTPLHSWAVGAPAQLGCWRASTAAHSLPASGETPGRLQSAPSQMAARWADPVPAAALSGASLLDRRPASTNTFAISTCAAQCMKACRRFYQLCLTRQRTGLLNLGGCCCKGYLVTQGGCIGMLSWDWERTVRSALRRLSSSASRRTSASLCAAAHAASSSACSPDPCQFKIRGSPLRGRMQPSQEAQQSGCSTSLK
jgi:hypothetical protein